MMKIVKQSHSERNYNTKQGIPGTTVQHSAALDDEICTGGPNVWIKLKQSYLKCPTPCKVISYDLSRAGLIPTLYKDVDPNAAILSLQITGHREIAKEILMYDTNDMIGAIGGSLGLFLGFSFFDVISKCLQKFFELVFQNH